ncbi:hypothetical protein A6A29_15840 [Streptomyces sp. TSRI0281]|nr:hypothetical protein A6A29_15840 [Streptomyces sp. TSRI0281]
MVWLYSDDEQSWASIDYEPGASKYLVVRSGPRRLWDETETAYRWWEQQADRSWSGGAPVRAAGQPVRAVGHAVGKLDPVQDLDHLWGVAPLARVSRRARGLAPGSANNQVLRRCRTLRP